MIYLELFLGFLQVGCFAFGGAYGAIPLIRDIVLSYGWLTEDALTYMIGISESTPGPIMVNMATYVGSSQGGLPGAILATTAVVLPAFLILLLIVALLHSAMKQPYVQAALKGVKPCIAGIILATGLSITGNRWFMEGQWDLRAVIITVLLSLLLFGSPKFLHKKLSPIKLILLSAILGVVVYGII